MNWSGSSYQHPHTHPTAKCLGAHIRYSDTHTHTHAFSKATTACKCASLRTYTHMQYTSVRTDTIQICRSVLPGGNSAQVFLQSWEETSDNPCSRNSHFFSHLLESMRSSFCLCLSTSLCKSLPYLSLSSCPVTLTLTRFNLPHFSLWHFNDPKHI